MWEYDRDVHIMLLVDFRKAYNSIQRESLISVLKEFEIGNQKTDRSCKLYRIGDKHRKTEYMMVKKKVPLNDQNSGLEVEGHKFTRLRQFKYLGAMLIQQDEINCEVMAGFNPVTSVASGCLNYCDLEHFQLI